MPGAVHTFSWRTVIEDPSYTQTSCSGFQLNSPYVCAFVEPPPPEPPISPPTMKFNVTPLSSHSCIDDVNVLRTKMPA